MTKVMLYKGFTIEIKIEPHQTDGLLNVNVKGLAQSFDYQIEKVDLDQVVGKEFIEDPQSDNWLCEMWLEKYKDFCNESS